MKVQNKIAYYIDYSIQEIPSIAYIAYETGGIIYTDSELTFNSLNHYHPHLNIVFYEKIADIRKQMQTSGVSVIIYPDYHIRHFKDLQGVKHVQVFHGTSDKIYDFRRDVLEYDLFFIPGEHALERYRKRGLLKRDNGVMIGYPKLDRVFRGELSRNDELVKLRMNPDNKTVLYAPTWVDRASNSSWKKFHGILITCKPDNINLIVKLHPNLIRYRKNEIDEVRQQLQSQGDTLLLDRLPDIVPIMAASDVLVSDVSAVTREYLAFKRPLIFLSNKPKWFWSRQKITLWDCGRVITNPDKLWTAILQTIKNPDEYMNRIIHQLQKSFYKPDGQAASRAKEAILNLL
jgi:CDP-glycerol glycerophosphotransferase (TagB/SpsB family)